MTATSTTVSTSLGHRKQHPFLSKRLALHLFTGLVLVFLMLPLAVTVLISFSAGQHLEFPPPGWSLHWYRQILNDPSWSHSFVVSLEIGVLSTVVSLLLGVLTATALVRGRMRWKSAIYAIVLAPMIIPGIITAIAVFFFFARVHMIGQPVAIALGHSALSLPLAVVIITATLQGFDQRLEQAAVSLGAGPLRAFWKITVPIIAPAIISAALFAFLTSFDELLVSLFLASPETTTLPVQIWNSVQFELQPTIAAVSTLLIAAACVSLGAGAMLQKARSRKARQADVR